MCIKQALYQLSYPFSLSAELYQEEMLSFVKTFSAYIKVIMIFVFKCIVGYIK